MRLTRREKQAVGLGIAGIVLILAWRFGVGPTLERVRRLEQVVPRKRQALAKLQAQCDEYVALQAKLAELRAKVAAQGKDFSFLPFLERIAKRAGAQKNATYTQRGRRRTGGGYEEARVEIKMEKVSLGALTQYLLRMESSDAPIGVASLRIVNSRKTPGLLTAVVNVSTLVPAEKE